MIKQSFIDNDSILKKKFKILRMSIMLGNAKNREDMLKEYEETAREIDRYQRSLYEEILSSKMYTTTTLEEERDRLTDLIKFIEDRVNERNEFIDDYLNVTNNYLDGIDMVSEEGELPTYKLRLDNISRYLSNVLEMKEIEEILKDKRNELEEKYENKANSEIINSKLEEELIDEFNKIIISDEYYKNLNYLDIDNELEKIHDKINEKKDVMNTFISSYEALKNAGISGAEREEYLSYVQDAREDYYSCLEKKYILEIYKLVLAKEQDYDRLYEKREQIENILNIRKNSRDELEIHERDNLEYLYNICGEQFSIIKSQKYNMENIDRLITQITSYEDKLKELEEDNNREEIISLLDEFSVSKVVASKVELPEEKKIHDEIILKNNEVNEKPANMVVRISEPVKMNVKLASDTAKLVMKKVVIVLEPKKFSGKRDKIKEAELKLDEEKKNKLDTLEDNKEVDNSIVSQDIFLDEMLSENNVSDEIKINSSDEKEISIPAEIFIDDTDNEKTVDLFNETDPFLDDNEFEINKNNEVNEIGDVLEIKNIGTVKPNNVLSEIENMAKENDDIILPTMGITDNEKKDVPIVSENYIN